MMALRASIAAFALATLFLANAALADDGGPGFGASSSLGAGERENAPDLDLGKLNPFGSSETKAIDAFDASSFDVADMPKDRASSLALLRSNGQGLIANDALQAYLDGVLSRLVAASPVPDLPAKAFVIAHPDIKAGAYPDGTVFVSVGLLNDVESVEELAFVLAHELSHVLYRHHESDWLVNLQYKVMTSGRMLLGVAREIDRARGGDDASGKLGNAVLITEAAYEISDHALNPAWTRGQEEEADALGFDILLGANYDYSGALRFLRVLQAKEERDAKRYEASRAAAEAKIKADGERITQQKNAFQAALATAKDALKLGADSLKSSFDRDHKPATERRSDLNTYLKKHHRDYLKRLRDPKRKPVSAPLPWAEGGQKGEASAVIRNYDTAFAALAAMEGGELGKAEKLVRQALGNPTSRDSYMRYVFYEIRKNQGKRGLARKNLELALQGAEVSVPVYAALISEEVTLGHYPLALRYLDDARERLNDPPSLVPGRIEVYRAVGREQEMQSLLLQCQYEWPELAKSCRRAAGITKEQDDQADPKKDLVPAALKGKTG